MKIKQSFLAILTATSVTFLVQRSYAASDPTESPAPPAVAETSPARVPSKLLYKPPAEAGNIPTRVSGGARGGGVDTSLFALVPDHVALTTKAQPSLFWFQSRPAKAKLELTLVEPKKAKPLVALTSELANKAGIHRVKLANYKVELQPDVLYEWVVAIVPDAKNRSMDVIAKGTIKRIKASDDIAKSVENADDADRAAIYAQNGIWYDALEALTNAIEAHPNNASLREQRTSLLKQVGLPEAAAADKK